MANILITGAASGIGGAVASRIAKPGNSCMLHSRKNESGLEKRVSELREQGCKAYAVLGDLTDQGFAENLIAKTISKIGGIDQIVSNAGFAERGVFGEVEAKSVFTAEKGMPEAFFHIVTNALPYLKKSTCGRIVVVSSFVAHVFEVDGLFPATAAAKASLEALAKSLAAQLASDGITVNCVAPGYTKKDESGHSALSSAAWEMAARKIPMGRIGTPGDTAALISFLLSEDAGFITGQTIHVDGGLTLR
ncbi:MAG: short-chain dehydrogenase [Rhodospirillaceae bacterium]|nr:short-chain dehydrogenase [Rhodospirillaceae bacterium]|tara:strand:- start:1106 stop:1852 length:747 start_codon:yes stop_codon:yes gene_type:complete